MTDPTQPRFPIYIPSKSRAHLGYTMKALMRTRTPFRIVVEEHQRKDYADAFGAERVLVLDPQYIRDYDTCLPDFDETKSKGSGPARNFIWDHSISEGHDWHWIIDDNIRIFFRLHENQRIPVGDGSNFWLMEDFALRYRNLAMCGPHYSMFVPSRPKTSALTVNTRIFSCNLIRNDIPFRWRARYNEDVDLSLRILKAGWCTVLFKVMLADKFTTQLLPGGNTEAFYGEEGTRPKSELIVRLHPDVVTMKERWGRVHHRVDFRPFKQKLVLRDGVVLPEKPPIEYVMRRRAGAKKSRSPGVLDTSHLG